MRFVHKVLSLTQKEHRKTICCGNILPLLIKLQKIESVFLVKMFCYSSSFWMRLGTF